MRQIERQVRRRWVALRGLGFEAAQNDFLQPGGQVGAQLPGRLGRHPQPLAHSALGGGRAKGQLARGHLVEHHADREDVAAHIATHADDLLGRNPRR